MSDEDGEMKAWDKKIKETRALTVEDIDTVIEDMERNYKNFDPRPRIFVHPSVIKRRPWVQGRGDVVVTGEIP